MRYAQIRSMDISNGTGVGVSLFTQGCHFRCYNCHNPEQWSFSGGKEFTQEVQNEILELLDKNYITRFSVLGGEPLEQENFFHLACLLHKIKKIYPDKKIWLYTGYTWEHLQERKKHSIYLQTILENIDVMVDGRFIDDKKDITLKFKGSSNQRIIDVPQSLKTNMVVLYEV